MRQISDHDRKEEDSVALCAEEMNEIAGGVVARLLPPIPPQVIVRGFLRALSALCEEIGL